MLANVSKNRRKKRRRRKQNAQTLENATPSNNLEADDRSVAEEEERSDKYINYSPKVNKSFINEDVEIETAMMLKHLTKDSEYSLKRERDIEFFTSGLSPHILYELMKPKASNSEIEEYAKETETIEKSTNSTTRETYPNDGPMLASSYFNNELENIVVPFDMRTMVMYDVNQLYWPALTMPKQLPVDIESGAENPKQRNLLAEGHYMKRKPKILRINRAQFVNRLLEEGAYHWLDIQRMNVKNMFDIVVNKGLIKTFCAEQFHPMNYPLTHVFTEYETSSFQDRIFRIFIKDILFDVHPSFNSEQKLARQLEAMYDEFVSLKQNDIVTKIETKLNILRQLLATMAKSQAHKTTPRFDNLRVYREEVKELRKIWHDESAKQRGLMKTILEKWSELKKLRENQTNASTSLKLMIKTFETNPKNDLDEWNKRFGLEHSEMMSEAMAVYREQKHQRKKDSKKKNRDEEKPKKPNPIDIENELLEIFAKSMRPPGEQIIDFQLDQKTDANAAKNLPKYIIRLSMDTDHLDVPESTKLSSVGQAHFNTTFSIKFTTKLPHQLKFQIYEKQNLNLVKKIGEAFAVIPEDADDFQTYVLTAVDFTSQIGKNSYAGKIMCSFGWTMSNADAEHMKSSASELSDKIGTKTRNIEGTVGQWFSEQLMDPMDPDNHNLAAAIEKSISIPNEKGRKSSKNQQRDESKIFRLNEDLYAFCAREKLNDNKRIELLNARFNSDLKLKDCKLIPHNEVEIELPVDLKIFEDVLWVDPIDVQRYQGKKYLKHVYDIITNHCEVIDRNVEHHDLLIGDTQPTLYGALEALSNMFSPRRPLNPYRRTIGRKSNFREDFINQFNIIINVVRASGIPSRCNGDAMVHRRTSLASTVQNRKNVCPGINSRMFKFDYYLTFSSSSSKCPAICDGNIP